MEIRKQIMKPHLDDIKAYQLAEALYKIADVNHYMIGLVEKVNHDIMDKAEQILIEKQNLLNDDKDKWENSKIYNTIELAFTYIDNWRRIHRK